MAWRSWRSSSTVILGDMSESGGAAGEQENISTQWGAAAVSLDSQQTTLCVEEQQEKISTIWSHDSISHDRTEPSHTWIMSHESQELSWTSWDFKLYLSLEKPWPPEETDWVSDWFTDWRGAQSPSSPAAAAATGELNIKSLIWYKFLPATIVVSVNLAGESQRGLTHT